MAEYFYHWVVGRNVSVSAGNISPNVSKKDLMVLVAESKVVKFATK